MSKKSEGERVLNKYLIAGLGNPGRSHKKDRHNVGFMVIDHLAQRHNIVLNRVQMKAIVSDCRIKDRSVLLAKPQTFMNRSGDSISQLINYYRIPLSNLLVIYDEIDLPLGVLRLREKGGSGGHNGMKSIISHLGNNFSRLRLGVGRPPGKMDPAAYVLRRFGKDEVEIVEEMLDSAMVAVSSFLVDGIDLAMTRHNGSVIKS